ncbi:MAG: hypothetical protein WKG00_03135 [Polyangiaceae bacterium]
MKRSGMVCSGLMCVLAGCNSGSSTQTTASAEPAQSSPAAPAAASGQPNPFDTIRKLPTWKAAFDSAAPVMKDAPDKSSMGTYLFTAWAMDRMTWTDAAVSQDETSFALVKKDIDVARGKRMCATGSIVEIAADKSELGTRYVGLLLTPAMNIVHFSAAGSTGELVERSPARFCGVVTGVFSYSNSAGGSSHAIDVVGLFDLPENRTRIPKR